MREDKIKLPKLGEIVTTERALELCEHFGLDHLIKRIQENPDKYKSWKFDGCSALPDKLLGLFAGDWRDVTYKCCLPHDLGYAYGEQGDRKERKEVDKKFKSDLKTKAGMKKWIAFVFYTTVRVLGTEKFGFSFSWAFACK